MPLTIHKSVFFTISRIALSMLLVSQGLLQIVLYPHSQTVSAQEVTQVLEQMIQDGSEFEDEESEMQVDTGEENEQQPEQGNPENEESESAEEENVNNSVADEEAQESEQGEEGSEKQVRGEGEDDQETSDDLDNDQEEVQVDQGNDLSPRVVSSAGELRNYALQGEIVPVFNEQGEVTKAIFANTFTFMASNGVQAVLELGNSVQTYNGEAFDIQALQIATPALEELEDVPVEEVYGSTIFGIPGQHVIFEKPVQLQIPVEKEDGEEVEVFVKHEGEENFGTIGLTTDSSAACEDGVSSDESNIVVVENGMITIYTCGASTYGVGSTNSPATCGDGVVDVDESCDDGNQISGDGCGGTEGDTLGCELENGYICTSDAGGDGICDTGGVGSVQSCLSQVPGGVENGRYGPNQVFDVQRSPAFPSAGNTFTLSSMTTPYSSITSSQYTIGVGQYIEFFYNGGTCNINADNVGIRLYNSDGSLAATISDGGSIYGIGDEGFLHVSDGLGFGTFVSNLEGFSNGDSLVYTPRTSQAICLDLAEYPANPNPLTDGNTTNICDLIQECGDGIVQVGEECDDGNTTAGDGCDDTGACTIESGYECSGSPSSCSVIPTPSTSACPGEMADIWFGIDESGSVSAQEFNDGLDFMYQVSDAFDYDAVSGMQGGAFGWRTTVNNNVIPVTEDFGDPGDSGLIQNGNVSVDGDGKGIRELYGARTANGGTNLSLATNHMVSLLNGGATNGRRAGVEQVTVIITDASSSQLTSDASGGGNSWIQAANDLRTAGGNIVLVLTEEAYTSYYNGQSTSVVDQVVGTGGLLIAVPTYAEAADPAKEHISNLTEAICIMACDIDDGVRDCDSDGILNASDPNPIVAYAGADTGTVVAGSGVSIDIVANDDFEPSNGISLEDTGNGTAGGTIVFDETTGVMTYTSLASESGTTVTVEYEVCATSTSTCATALVSIDVACNPNDGTQDCDGDGNSNATDPNPSNPVAQDDGQFTAIPGSASEFDIIANDDFIAGPGITITDTGNGTAVGTVSFDTGSGTVSYTPDESEAGTVVTIEYQVCYTASGVCATATVTILAGGPCIDPSTDPTGDVDGDGIINSTEIALGDSDGDGVINCEDRDDDNDGILSIDEGTQDPDRDGLPNYLDLDSDGDTVSDVREAGGEDANEDGKLGGDDIVVDEEGVVVSDVSGPTTSPSLIDTDEDGKYDPYDTDDDGDACPTAYEVSIESDYLSDVENCESGGSSSVGKKSFVTKEHGTALEEKEEDVSQETEQLEEDPVPEETVEEEVLEDEAQPLEDVLPLVEELIECAEVLSRYRESVSCYYQDGVFNGSQWNDIAQSPYSSEIVAMTKQCYYHGPRDTQTTFNPNAFVSQGELIKIAVRMGRYLPQSFSHFDATAEEWFVPYYEAALEAGLLEGTEVSKETIYENAKAQDITMILGRILVSHDIISSASDMQNLIPSSYSYKNVRRDDFASIVATVHQKLYGEIEQNNELPEAVQTCMDMIDTSKATTACAYADGSFDGNQWSDIEGLEFEDAVRAVTDACLIHGGDDTQSRYEPYAPATYAAGIKIAARMGGFLPEGFNHFDASVWYGPYYDVLQYRGIVEASVLERMNATITLYDLMQIYMQVLLSSIENAPTAAQIQAMIPDEYATQTINRSGLAVITELFRSYLK